MTPTIRSAALSALLLFAAAVTAQAQAQPPAGPGGPRGPHPIAAQMQAMHNAHERQRAQDLRTILRLRPDQEAALSAFLASRRPAERRGPPEAPPQAMTTPQRLDEMARREAEHAAVGQRYAEALRSFYAALSPDQRQVFDALQRMQGAGGHGPGGFGRRGFGPPMGGPPPR